LAPVTICHTHQPANFALHAQLQTRLRSFVKYIHCCASSAPPKPFRSGTSTYFTTVGTCCQISFRSCAFDFLALHVLPPRHFRPAASSRQKGIKSRQLCQRSFTPIEFKILKRRAWP